MTSDASSLVTEQRSGSTRGGTRLVHRLTAAASAAGCVAILAFASAAGSWGEYARAVAALLMAAGSACASGALVGFLFGIPRTTVPPEGEQITGGAASRATDAFHYRVNTNLEQISDWLTKILIGVGLAELHQAPGLLGGAADYLARAIGGRAAAELTGFIVPLLVYFSIVGLMAGYLGTRMLLAPLLRNADSRRIGAAIGDSPAR